MDNVIGLFPTPLMISKYENSFETELEYVKKLTCSKENKKYDQTFNYQSDNTFILEQDIFANLKAFFEEQINVFSNEVLGSVDKLKITQSWINKNYPGHYHQEHSHPNSILSGVFYFVLDENMPSVCFRKPIIDPYSLLTYNYNEYNAQEMNINASSGELILFPSNLHHSVPKNTSQKVRISLSFNTFGVGSIGSADTTTYLSL